MSTRDLPRGMKKVGAYFHQDTPIIHASADDAIAMALAGLSFEERIELGHYLARMLSGPTRIGNARSIWRRSRAEFGFTRAEQLAAFLEKVRDAALAADAAEARSAGE